MFRNTIEFILMVILALFLIGISTIIALGLAYMIISLA